MDGPEGQVTEPKKGETRVENEEEVKMSHVAVAERRNKNLRYPWDKLANAGDTFQIPAPKDAVERQKMASNAEIAGKMWSKSKTGGKARFWARSTRSGIEVVRIANS